MKPLFSLSLLLLLSLVVRAQEVPHVVLISIDGLRPAFYFDESWQTPNLTAIHFLGADHTQHRHGTDSPEVRRAVHVIDSMIGTVQPHDE